MLLNSDSVTDLATYRELWKKGLQGGTGVPAEYPDWPARGIALIGDFSGIQKFVLRPVPGAGGAARRLRARSFRVSAYTEMIARWCLRELSSAQPHILYSAGGRFVLRTNPFSGWQARVRELQSRIDAWAWRNFQGELVFHLAAADFSSPKIPNSELKHVLEKRRLEPMAAVLRPSQWASSEFFQPATPSDGRCAACGMTRPVQTNAEGELCDGCLSDEEIGRKLARSRFVRLLESGGATTGLAALDFGMDLRESMDSADQSGWLALETPAPGAEPWLLLRYVPSGPDGALDFDQIAQKAAGRKWLGYLRIDADHAGRSFAQLVGDPLRTWSLSRLLDRFFTAYTNEILRTTFPNIYAVYGGGDDLFVIGPWDAVLDFALCLRREFAKIAGNDLSFSAGISMAKPREHILTQARRAHEELESAKAHPAYNRGCGRDQIRALGVTADWDTFDGLLQAAKRVTWWVQSGDLPSSFLHQMLELHHAWCRARQHSDRERAALVRYQPLLYYQIRRNLRGPAAGWAHSLLHTPSQWPWVDFIVRYANLAGQQPSIEED
jgi:CRISPR-associated protein Csm1